ncbi:MAG: 16S rRNA (adenine(1518)-N(6)/adenine(1519)-N(6))-dimethyltransferase RsmA [Woeseia sp.]
MTAPHTARKRFGQHFLTSLETIERIVAAIAARAGDVVVEIGPGRGAITAGLAKSGATVHAIEFDRDLTPRLRQNYQHLDNVFIHEADALRFDYAGLGDALRIVGNLPYNISTPLLFRMIEFATSVQDLHFMLQKEVVDRITASPGTKAYGRLTIMLGSRLHAEPLFDVPASAFQPPPRVTSSVVRLWPRPAGELTIVNAALMSRIVAQAFSQRRKTLRNALRASVAPDDLSAVHIDAGARAEEVPVEAWVALANRLSTQA